MKNNKNHGRVTIASILSIMLFVLVFTGCPNPMDEADNGGDAGGGDTVPTAVTGITLDQTAAALIVGETLRLTAAVEPAGAEDTSVTLSSGASAVATVTGAAAGGVHGDGLRTSADGRLDSRCPADGT